MRKFISYKFVFALIFVSIIKNASALSLDNLLKQCLRKQWSIDYNTANYIVYRLRPLLDNPVHNPIVEDFISKSQKLNINFSKNKKLTQIHESDGIIKAPKQHLVIFENPWIRILWGSTQPGESENCHTHIWKSLMIIIKPTTFAIKYADGTTEIGDWPIGVYELPENESYECTNVGDTADECLRFEIKS